MQHDSSISSVGMEIEGAVDGAKLDEWMRGILRDKGVDIFRMKGIINIHGSPNRFVFQGVHMLFDGEPDRPWKPGEKKNNKIVFIGRNLNTTEIETGFRNCLKV